MSGSTELDGKTALFTEEQRLLTAWRWVFLILALVIMAVVLWSWVAGDPVIPRGRPAAALYLGVAAGVLVPLFMFSLKLSVRVTDSHIHIHFRPLKKRSIPISEVTSCATRRYSPIREYGGWGMRLGRRGWAYTVSGREGVQLEFKSGRGLLIGSHDAARLEAAIKRGMARGK